MAVKTSQQTVAELRVPVGGGVGLGVGEWVVGRGALKPSKRISLWIWIINSNTVAAAAAFTR